jgi:hypothetical protein
MTNFNHKIQLRFYPVLVIFLLLVLAYSPYYIYNYLMVKFLDGGNIRALFGLASACSFFILIFFHTYRKKITFSKNVYLFIFVFLYLWLVALLSAFLGRDFFYIAYELYPMLEGLLFFMIGYYLVAIGFKKEMMASLLLFCAVNVFFDLFITLYYYAFNFNFAYVVDVGGILVNRIPDSMLPVYLAISLVMSKYYNYGQLKYIAHLLVVVTLILLLISFWRTLMISGFIVLLFYIYKHKKYFLTKKSILYLFLLTLSILPVSIIVEGSTGMSIELLSSERMSSAFDENKSRSIGSRILDSKVVLLQILQSPIIGNGFGGLYSDLSGSHYYLSSTSNYLLRLIAHFGLLVSSIMFFGVYYFFRNMQKFSRHLTLKNNIEGASSLALLQLLNYVSLSTGIILIAFPSVLHYPLLLILFMLFGAVVQDKKNYKINGNNITKTK